MWARSSGMSCSRRLAASTARRRAPAQHRPRRIHASGRDGRHARSAWLSGRFHGHPSLPLRRKRFPPRVAPARQRSYRRVAGSAQSAAVAGGNARAALLHRRARSCKARQMTQANPGDRGVAGELGSAAAAALMDVNGVKATVTVLFSAGAAYVLGGVVLALRLTQAGLPVQDSLEAVPASALLVAGVRELLISAVTAFILVALMLSLSSIPKIPNIVGIAVVPLALLMIVPLNAGGLVWPIGLAILGALFTRMARQGRDHVALRPTAAQILAMALAVVFVVTLLRYTVPPYKLPRGVLSLQASKSDHVLKRYGGYLGSSGDFVYLVNDDPPTVRAYARDRVLAIEIKPPPASRRYKNSLYGLMFGARFAMTPLLDMWTDDGYHGLRLLQ